MKLVNTQDAHILLNYAREFGLQTKLNVRLAEAFFGEQKDISDREVLDQELGSVGLNADEALKTLENDNARKQVQTQEAYWLDKGVSGVPTMIFNSSTAINGAQAVNTYKEVLAETILKLWNYEKIGKNNYSDFRHPYLFTGLEQVF